MNRFVVNDLILPASGTYHTVFVSAGYESRCTAIASNFAGAARNKVALIYEDDRHERTAANREALRILGYSEVMYSKDKLRHQIATIVLEAASSPEALERRILVDISSMTREIMAHWIYQAMSTKVPHDVVIDFGYSHAKFIPPNERVSLAKAPSAIIPEFAGCFEYPTAPIMLVIGIGYEPQLALSFLEYIEPAKVVVFEPSHHDREYTDAINRINRTFLKIVSNSPHLNYNVYKPYLLFQDLESVIRGGSAEYRVQVAPYGLKLFVISSLLASAVNFPNVLVWHLNSETSLVDVGDRVPSGRLSGLAVRFTCSDGVADGLTMV